MNCRRRHRVRIAIAVAACLVFQQIALAAYSCSGPQPAPPSTSSSEHCATMASETDGNPALCAAHCSPDSPAPTDFAKVATPALAPALIGYVQMSGEGSVARTVRVDEPPLPAGPPPRLRYCSLLI